jgi:TRAP transporter TAXI family solute receptor
LAQNLPAASILFVGAVMSNCLRTILSILFALVLFHIPAANAEQLPARHEDRIRTVNNGAIGLISGGVSGTYIKIAADIQAVVDKVDDLRVLPIVGKGSVQNITDLLYLRGIDIAIVQSDVLTYLRNQNTFPDLENRISYITKLYNEEFHLVARHDITDVNQLAGKTVNFGPSGSGTAMTAQTVFEALNIDVVGANENYADALQKVKTGEIAAMVYVAGKPASLFTELKESDGLHIVPVAYTGELQKSYLPATVNSSDYAGLVKPGQSVDTISVGAVMAVFNWKKKTGRYYPAKRFIEAFFSNFPEFLKEPRHPKWKEVNLAAKLPGWTRYSAAEDWLRRNASKPISAAPADTRKEQLLASFNAYMKNQPQAGQLSENDRNELFQQFLKWTEAASAAN